VKHERFGLPDYFRSRLYGSRGNRSPIVEGTTGDVDISVGIGKDTRQRIRNSSYLGAGRGPNRRVGRSGVLVDDMQTRHPVHYEADSCQQAPSESHDNSIWSACASAAECLSRVREACWEG
jgi:hypothetical protein